LGLLRVVLALFVVIEHANTFHFFNFPGAVLAVKVFFIISGFYMTLILDKKYVGKGSYSLFISNRLLRLYPIYWVVLGLTVLISFSSHFLYNDWLRLTAYVVYDDILTIKALLFLGFTNIFLIGQDLYLFLGLDVHSGNLFFTSNFSQTDPRFYSFLFVPQAWTLSLELMFYIIAPFIVRKKLKIVILLIFISLLIRGFIYFYLNMPYDPWTFRFFPNELVFFLLGVISYRIYEYINRITVNKKLIIALISIFYFLMIFNRYLPETGVLEYIVPIIFYTIACLSIPFIFQMTRNNSKDNRIGELSYPIYITHLLIIYIVRILFDYYDVQLDMGPTIIIITIIVSYVLLKLVADPIEKLRQSRVKIS